MSVGNIPADLSQLSSLERLDLSNNILSGNDAISDVAASSDDDDMNSGNIPAELCQLSSLQSLHLYNNNLSGNQ
jgi:hypothetical protein